MCVRSGTRFARWATRKRRHPPRFRIVRDFDHPIIERYRRFLAANGIAVAGIEFITDRTGELYTYDVNTNTNYNPGAAEAEAGVYGMRAIAAYLGSGAQAAQAREAARESRLADGGRFGRGKPRGQLRPRRRRSFERRELAVHNARDREQLTPCRCGRRWHSRNSHRSSRTRRRRPSYA